MVQRFSPEIKVQYHDYEEYPDRFVVMNHTRDGEWVKYETYRDAIAQLRAQLARELLRNSKPRVPTQTYDTPDGTSVPVELIEGVQCLADVLNVAAIRQEQRSQNELSPD